MNILAALLLSSVLAAEADPAGYDTLLMPAPHHGQALQGAIWYPTSRPGREIVIAENQVFHGVTVSENAPIADGAHPLVLLSHGLGGQFRSLAWLATGLAERGAIVIAVNHPNSTWGDFDHEAYLDHWTRVQDLTVALEWVLGNPRIGPHVDTNRTMAAGFSYGGWTALSMGGLRGNLAGYAAHCKVYRPTSAMLRHCQAIAADIDLLALSAETWDMSYADERITHVAAIDPGFIWGLESVHVSDLINRVTLVGLGKGDDRLVATDFDTSGFAELLPDAGIVRLAPAFHFSALPLCKPRGVAILEEEGDEPVCTDPGGADRAALHAAIIDRLARDLDL
ncbi:MAG: hypothetical protein TH68_08015 [Candidatus Synechococcus spongiarum 142]|uniref:Dienelactone hydrolase n=1 Tax=Candidatus Synechococcus spongiarum 142 TaxID=1608213 RepID=A0A6N3X3I0_9SYNE|nr:MAG: hypothetical protein TH68_08015 [Candidatus Synechococcus spongiarum 142]